MDSSIYYSMLSLKQELNSNDIFYYGTIHTSQKDSTNTNVINTSDVFLVVQGFKEHPIYNFVDKAGNIIATNRVDGYGVIPSKSYADILTPNDLSLMNSYQPSSSYSLNNIEKQLNLISKKIGVSKERIMAISELELSELNSTISEILLEQNIEEGNTNKTDPDLSYTENQSQIKFNRADIKQETDPEQRINDRTLRELFQLPPDVKKIVVADTDNLQTQKNGTPFTLLYMDKNNNLHEMPNAKQVGGNNPTNQIAMSNSNGDNVTFSGVTSMYTLDGTDNRQYLFTISRGSYGSIDLGIGQVDPTQGINETDNPTSITVPLKTSHTYYTNAETRREIVGNHRGTLQANKRRNEAQKYQNQSATRGVTVAEVDGNEQTSHQHIDEYTQFQLMKRLIAHSPDNALIIEYFNRNELFQKIGEIVSQNNLIGTLDELEEIVRNKLNDELTNIEPERTIYSDHQSA